MKRLKLLLLALVLLMCLPLPVQAGVNIKSECAVLMDMDTGQILYEKKGRQVNIMGNMTKLVNVSTALHHGDLGDLLTINNNCLAETTRDSLAGNLGLVPGQMITLEDALYAEILANANDAARVVAGNLGNEDDKSIGTADDVKVYLGMMKDEAKYLNAASASMASVMGMWSPDQICSAVDLANIMRLGFADSDFRRILTTKRYDFSTYRSVATPVKSEVEDNKSNDNQEQADSKDTKANTNKSEEKTDYTTTLNKSADFSLESSHAIVKGDRSYRGVKGGFVVPTENNGYHSVTYAKRTVAGEGDEGVPRKFVVAIMNSPDADAMYDDIAALLDYGFDEWHNFTLAANKLDDFLPDDLSDKKIVFSSDLNCLLPKNMGKGDLKANTAVMENNYCGGSLTFTADGVSQPIATVAFYEDDNIVVLSAGAKIAVYILCALLVLGTIFLLLRFVILPYYNKVKAARKKAKSTAHKSNRPRHRRRSSNNTPQKTAVEQEYFASATPPKRRKNRKKYDKRR